MCLMTRKVTVVVSRTFLVATVDGMINYKPISFLTVLPMHSRLSHNLRSNNTLLPEERGFKKGVRVESAAFRLTRSAFKECVWDEFYAIWMRILTA